MSCSCIGWAFCFVLFRVVVGRVSEGGCNSPSGQGEVFVFLLWSCMLAFFPSFYFTVLVFCTVVGDVGRCGLRIVLHSVEFRRRGILV